MDTLASSRESYRRVHSQTSCEEPVPGQNDVWVANSAHKNCTCSDTKTLVKWIKIVSALSVLAVLLALTAVSIVTIQWINSEQTDKESSRHADQCVCPSLTADDTQHVQFSADDVTSNGVVPDMTSQLPECIDCRIRRDGARAAASLLHAGTGHRGRARCNRACRGEIDNIRSEMAQSQNTAIHFQGFPPGLYDLGQDGAYKWWRPATWYSQMDGFYYNHSSGHVTIMEAGVYFIYSQVEHPTEHNQAHSVMINSTAFLRCVKSAPPSRGQSAHDQSSCYLGGATALGQHDEVWIKSTHTQGQVLVKQESSYWGIIKLTALTAPS